MVPRRFQETVSSYEKHNKNNNHPGRERTDLIPEMRNMQTETGGFEQRADSLVGFRPLPQLPRRFHFNECRCTDL